MKRQKTRINTESEKIKKRSELIGTLFRFTSIKNTEGGVFSTYSRQNCNFALQKIKKAFQMTGTPRFGNFKSFQNVDKR